MTKPGVVRVTKGVQKKFLFINISVLILLSCIIIGLPVYLLLYPDYVDMLIIRCCLGYGIAFNCYIAFFFIRLWRKRKTTAKVRFRKPEYEIEELR